METSTTHPGLPGYARSLIILLVSAALVIAGIMIYRQVTKPRFLPYTPTAADRAPDHFLAKFKPGAPADEVRSLNARNGVEEKGGIPALGVKILTVPPSKTPEDMVAIYSRNPNIEFAEVDSVMSATLTPNDTYWANQSTAMSRISAPSAWDLSTGSDTVTLAIIDTGIDFTHPDLAGRTTPGYDFVNLDADPTDDHGHGTLCAGVAAATGNNAKGVAGVNWKVRIMPVKVLGSTGSGLTSNVAKGINYAADNGARVLSMSLGGPAASTLKAAVDYARGKGCVLAAATGNDGLAAVSYPAAYDGVIGVGALQGDVVATFSNFGPEVDVVAPGVSVYTTAKGGGYAYFSGTSAATPFIAGLAAMDLGVAPSLTADAVSAEITSTATDLGSAGWDQYYGWGRINMQAALTAALNAGAPAPSPTPTTTPEPTASPAPTTTPPATTDVTAPTVSITSPAAGSTVSGTVTIAATATDDTGVTRVDLMVDGQLLASTTASPYSVAWNTKNYANGGHAVSVVAYDGAGHSASAQVSVTVSNVVRRKK